MTPIVQRTRSLVERFAATAKHFGSRAALHELETLALNRAVPVSILRGMTAVPSDIDPGLFDPGRLSARFVERHELLTIAGIGELAGELAPSFIRAALAKGDRCFGLFDGETLVSFGWYSQHPTRISDDLVLHFDPAWVYMYKGYTLRRWRGKRLHGIGMALAMRAYVDQGARGLISYVRSNNFESLRSTERMGYRRFGDIYLMTLFGHPRTWATPGCAAYQFRVDRATPLVSHDPPEWLGFSASYSVRQ
ncbi:MAG: GNAT family acetyltransferase [Kofleriaceae bacterium]